MRTIKKKKEWRQARAGRHKGRISWMEEGRAIIIEKKEKKFKEIVHKTLIKEEKIVEINEEEKLRDWKRTEENMNEKMHKEERMKRRMQEESEWGKESDLQEKEIW